MVPKNFLLRRGELEPTRPAKAGGCHRWLLLTCSLCSLALAWPVWWLQCTVADAVRSGLVGVAQAESTAERRVGEQPAEIEPVRPGGGEGPARPLPREMTICQGASGCWSELDPASCRAQGGRVFRTLPVDESPSLPEALRECVDASR